MSYVRFSSDDFRSDFYIYEHVDGFFVVHVAASRRDPGYNGFQAREDEKIKVDEASYRLTPEGAARLSKELHQYHVEIDHPDAGQMFAFGTMREVIDKVEELIAKGFNAPDWLLDHLREDEDAVAGE